VVDALHVERDTHRGHSPECWNEGSCRILRPLLGASG
jgi:hypothetical protein